MAACFAEGEFIPGISPMGVCIWARLERTGVKRIEHPLICNIKSLNHAWGVPHGQVTVAIVMQGESAGVFTGEMLRADL